ncbi:MAG: phenylacetic acid degradation b [Cyclobacteriaceae bacterium]|nr:phenylacetic acid degradation b [Cyclobacteriaceae bacterium]
MEKVLDPRFQRLDIFKAQINGPTEKLDQLPTFEVFVLLREAGIYQHEGIVHAPDREMAFLFAKEQFSRRQTCAGIWTIETPNIFVSPYSENKVSIYDAVQASAETGNEPYKIFHMLKRGKQHKYAGKVHANSPEHALQVAKAALDVSKPVLNAWVARESDFFETSEEDKEIWNTLPEKTFREAIDYKGQAKIDAFLAENNKTS